MEGQRWDTAQDVDDYVLEKTMMKILQEENDDKGALPSQSSNTKAPPRGGGWAWQVYAYIALMFFTFFWVVDLSAGGFVFTAVSSLVSTPNQAPAHDSSGRQGGVKTGQEPSLRGFGAKLYQQASTSSKFILPKEGKGQSSFLATSNAPGCKGVLGCGAESPPKSSDAASSSFFALAVGTDPWEHAAPSAKKFREGPLAGRAVICLLGGIGKKKPKDHQQKLIRAIAKELEARTAADGDRVAFVTGGMPVYPQSDFTNGFGVKARVWSLVRENEQVDERAGTRRLPIPPLDEVRSELPIDRDTREKTQRSDVLGHLCDIALVAGGGPGVERSINLMQPRDAPVIPIRNSATDDIKKGEHVSVSNNPIYDTPPKWAPTAMWEKRDKAEGIAKLVMGTPKMMAQELRDQLRLPGGGTTICFVGGLDVNVKPDESQKSLMGNFAKELLKVTAKYGRKVVFITGWKANVLLDAFNEIDELKTSGRLWSVAERNSAEGAQLLKLGEGFVDLSTGEEKSRRNGIISEMLGGDGLCDILVSMGGGPNTAATIEAADRRGTPIIPIPGFGGPCEEAIMSRQSQSQPAWAPTEIWKNEHQQNSPGMRAMKLVLNTPRMLALYFREMQIPFGATTICVLGSKEKATPDDNTMLKGVVKKVVQEIDSTGSKVAFVTGGMSEFPQEIAAEKLGNTGRLYNLGMVSQPGGPYGEGNGVTLQVPGMGDIQTERKVKSAILGELCDVALIAGGGGGTRISLSGMARRKDTYVIPVPSSTDAKDAVSQAIIGENSKPQWAPAQLWANLGRAQASVEAVANLVVAVPKIAARYVRKQMEFSVKTTVCLVSGNAKKDQVGEFATELAAHDAFSTVAGAIAFVSGGVHGAEETETALHKTLGSGAHRYHLAGALGSAVPTGSTALSLNLGQNFGTKETLRDGTEVASREEKDIKSAILGELCDVMLVAGGGPGAIMSVKAAERRNAPVIPLPGTAGNGGYSEQLIAKGEKPQWAPTALWNEGKNSVESAVALLMSTPQLSAHTLRNKKTLLGKTPLCVLGFKQTKEQEAADQSIADMVQMAENAARDSSSGVMIVTAGLKKDQIFTALTRTEAWSDNIVFVVPGEFPADGTGDSTQEEKNVKSAIMGELCDVALVYQGGLGVHISAETFARRGVPTIPMVGSGGAADVLATRPHPDWAPAKLWGQQGMEPALLQGAPPIYAHTIRSRMEATDKTIVCMAGSAAGFPEKKQTSATIESAVSLIQGERVVYLSGGMAGFPSVDFARAVLKSFALAPQDDFISALQENEKNANFSFERINFPAVFEGVQDQEEKDIKSAYLGAACDVVVVAGGGKGTVITKEAMAMRGKEVIELK